MKKIPVIFDTDICDDIDDLYAMLCCVFHPQIDLKAVTVVHSNVMNKARFVRKVLDMVGAEDVPVGVGKPISLARILKNQHAPEVTSCYDKFAFDMPMGKYPSAYDVITKVLEEAEEPVTIICEGAMTNAAEAVINYPDFRQKCGGFAVMAGETRYLRKEHNIMCDPEASEVVFNSRVPVFVGTYCETFKLELPEETVYSVFSDMTNPVHRILKECQDLWWGKNPRLYDIAPVFYLTNPELFDVEECALHTELEGRFTRGITVPDYNAAIKMVKVTVGIKEKEILEKCVNLLK